jgi:hypothetical protein
LHWSEWNDVDGGAFKPRVHGRQCAFPRRDSKTIDASRYETLDSLHWFVATDSSKRSRSGSSFKMATIAELSIVTPAAQIRRIQGLLRRRAGQEEVARRLGPQRRARVGAVRA